MGTEPLAQPPMPALLTTHLVWQWACMKLLGSFTVTNRRLLHSYDVLLMYVTEKKKSNMSLESWTSETPGESSSCVWPVLRGSLWQDGRNLRYINRPILEAASPSQFCLAPALHTKKVLTQNLKKRPRYRQKPHTGSAGLSPPTTKQAA